jgi:chromate transporter
MAETTPGPLILTLQFVGFMAGFQTSGGSLAVAVLGAGVTLWVTFVPCFLWVFALAPQAERLRSNARLAGALAAVTAAVVGVIANLGLWFAVHALFAEVRVLGAMDLPVWSSLDPVLAGLTLLALALAFGTRLPVWALILGGALAGVGVQAL